MVKACIGVWIKACIEVRVFVMKIVWWMIWRKERRCEWREWGVLGILGDVRGWCEMWWRMMKRVWWREWREERSESVRSAEEGWGWRWWGWGCREIGYYPKLGAHQYEFLIHQYEFLAHYDKNLALYGGLFPYIFTIFRPYMFIDISYYSLYRIIKKKCLNYYFSIIYTI